MKTEIEINKVLNELRLRESEVVTISEDERGVIAVAKTISGIIKAISEEYCGAKVVITNATYNKHDYSVELETELEDEDGEIDARDFTLLTTVVYH